MNNIMKELEAFIISNAVKEYKKIGLRGLRENLILSYGLGNLYSNKMIALGYMQDKFSFDYLIEYEDIVSLWSSIKIEDKKLNEINEILNINEYSINKYKQNTINNLITLGFPKEIISELDYCIFSFIERDYFINREKFNKEIEDLLLDYSNREEDYSYYDYPKNLTWNSCALFFKRFRNLLNIKFETLINETNLDLNEINKLEHGYINSIDLTYYLNYLNNKLNSLINIKINYGMLETGFVIKDLSYLDYKSNTTIKKDLFLIKNTKNM